jgi:hypothetical protein
MGHDLENKPGASSLVEGGREGATGGTPGKRTLTEQLGPHPPDSPQRVGRDQRVAHEAPAEGALSAKQRAAAQAQIADDLTMEQIAHRLAYLDGDLPAGEPEKDEERVREGDAEQAAAEEHWTAPRKASVNTLDRTALRQRGFDTDQFQFFTGQAGLQLWILPVLPGATVTPVIAFRGTATGKDLAEDLNGAGVGMGQFTMNQAVIQAAVRKVARGRGAVATGHSLGGALAQIAACFYPDAIVSVVTFQAPGIPREVLDRLRTVPPDAQPTARHHRVAGDLVDDAGEDVLPGAVMLHGNDHTSPIAAHKAFPVLSERQREADAGGAVVPDFARGKIDPGVGSTTRTGTTESSDMGRDLGGVAETARRHPTAGGAVVGLMLSELFPGPPGIKEAIGSVSGALYGNYLAGQAAPGEAYARIWLNVQRHADAGDLELASLERDLIVAPCKAEGHEEHIQPMMDNLVRMYPEYPAIQLVVEHQPDALQDVGEFIAAVSAHAPDLPPAALARLHVIFPRHRRPAPTRNEPPGRDSNELGHSTAAGR